METERKGKAPRKAVRVGRPPKEFAAEVDKRILNAARELFLARGLEGVSVEEIARLARASKATIYARFSTKEALFAAIAMRNAEKVREGYESAVPSGDTIEERLTVLGSEILKHVLAADSVDFMRLAAAEARRFPDLAKVERMMRERGTHHAATVLKDVTHSKQGRAYAAFAPERLTRTAQFFLDLVVAPLVMRAVFGEDPKRLKAQIRGHVAESVSFFLAACRTGEPRRWRSTQQLYLLRVLTGSPVVRDPLRHTRKFSRRHGWPDASHSKGAGRECCARKSTTLQPNVALDFQPLWFFGFRGCPTRKISRRM